MANALWALGVPVVLVLAGWLIYRFFAVRVITASAKVCRDPHFYSSYGDPRPDGPLHIDVNLQLAARLRLAVTVLSPVVTAKQELRHTQEAVTLSADGKPADLRVELHPMSNEPLVIAPGDWLRVKLPVSSGGGPRRRKLRVR